MPSLAVQPRRFASRFASIALAQLPTSGPAHNAPQDCAKAIALVPPFENLAKRRDYVMYDVPSGW